MAAADSKLTRIGVFYDGNFFYHVSNYYAYHHSRRARISVSGLHEFICRRVAEEEGCDVRYCQIVDAHYFRGRYKASDAQEHHLRNDRIFDDVLMREGVVTHYLPLVQNVEGGFGEKGIDIWFALEAYELAIYKRFDVSVLITGDGDFLPLVRKLNTLGTRVMLLGWEFQWMNNNQEPRETRTNQLLLNEVTYPVEMHTIINSKVKDQTVENLFVPHNEMRETARSTYSILPSPPSSETLASAAEADEFYAGKIHNMTAGYGFIEPDAGAPNMFFFYTEVKNKDFNELAVHEKVKYKLGKNAKGACAVDVYVIP
jgi:cold shock CspA family protein/uncharacterized LabA/DUF88 family protein